MEKAQSLLGIAVFLAVAYGLSNSRRKIDYKLVINATLIQLALAILLLGVPFFNLPAPFFFIFSWANSFFLNVLNFTQKGTEFLFGPLVDVEKTGFVMALQVLPTIIFFSSLSSVLYHFKILPLIIAGFSKVLKKTLNISGAEALSTVANVFVGQTEAPLTIKPYLPRMTKSEVFTVMVGGMATVAGGVMAVYVGFLSASIPDIAGHLVVASVLSAPAAILFAKMMFPETEKPETMGDTPTQTLLSYENVIDAAASGAADGLKLAANVGAMLLAFVALIYMCDAILIQVGEWIGFASWGGFLTPGLANNEVPQLNLTVILSWLFIPASFFLGIPWEECFLASGLLGKKIVFNEFFAYFDLAQMGESFSPRSRIILSYALCGFSNFSSIAIQIGGIGGLAPNRKKDLAQMGIKAIIGGSLAAFMTACIAGILY